MVELPGWPGEKLLIRLLEIAEKSCIGLARPWLIKREGTAKAASEYRNKLALGQAEKDLEEVKAGRARYDATAGRLVPLVRPLPSIPELSSLPATTTALPAPDQSSTYIPRLGSALDFATHTLLQSTVKEMERTINLERTLQKAEAEAEGVPDEAVSESAPNPDWISRWREGAQDVTDEQVQLLWARILTSEVRQPGCYSLRTLDFMRSVSRSEAELIEVLSRLKIKSLLDVFVFRDNEVLERHGLNVVKLLTLQSLGLISGAEGTLSIRIQADTIPFFDHYDLGISWKRPEGKKSANFQCYSLTPLGQELANLGSYQGDREYLRGLARYLGGKGGLRVTLGALTRTPSGHIHISPDELFGPVDVEPQT